MNQNAAPIVSFHRGEQSFTLGTESDAEVLHLHGSTGLGLAPIAHSLSDRIGASGSLHRGVRYEARELFLPLLIYKDSYAEATAVRRQLYRFLAPHLGPVEIRIEDPATGTCRGIFGYLKGGLDGDFGGDFHGNWQKIGLTFICPDPWWLGEPRMISLKVNPGIKPFLSETVPFFPVTLAQSTLKGEYNLDIQGDGPIFPVWEVTGAGQDLTLTSGKGETFRVLHTLKEGESYTIDTEKKLLTPDLWDKVPLDSQMFALAPGLNRLSVSMVGATERATVTAIYRERFMEAI